MAVPRRLILPSIGQKQQWLRVDHKTRFASVHSNKWLTLLGPDSSLSISEQEVKLAARFNDSTFSNIQITSYLYDKNNSSTSSASSCLLRVYKVDVPDWTETFVTDLSTTLQPNSYFYANPTIASLGLSFQGGDTLMIEAIITRLGINYRERIYVNHLGIYDNVTRLRQDVEFLEVTKKDL